MLVRAFNIKYNNKTQEWKIDINALAGYKQYIDDPNADHSIWRFGDFMSFNNLLPTYVDIEVPYTDLITEADEITTYIKARLKEKTSREIDSFRLVQIE